MLSFFNRYDQTPGGVNVAGKDLKARLDKGEKITLLDVREQWEYDTAKIEAANLILIPLGELQDRFSELNPENEIVAYCHGGVRSLKAVNFLKTKGFQKIFNLSGGIAAWSKEVDPSVPEY